MVTFPSIVVKFNDHFRQKTQHITTSTCLNKQLMLQQLQKRYLSKRFNWNIQRKFLHIHKKAVSRQLNTWWESTDWVTDLLQYYIYCMSMWKTIFLCFITVLCESIVLKKNFWRLWSKWCYSVRWELYMKQD